MNILTKVYLVYTRSKYIIKRIDYETICNDYFSKVKNFNIPKINLTKNIWCI